MKKWIAVIIILIVILGSLGLYLFSQIIVFPTEKTVTVNIKKGSGLPRIAEALEDSGAVKNKNVFIVYAYFSGKHKNFYPGKYVFNAPTPYPKVVEMLDKGAKRIVYKLTIPEGYTVKQVSERVEDKLGIPKEKLLSAVSDYKDKNPDYGEGFLFPETYFFYGSAKAEDVVRKFNDQFSKETNSLDAPKGYSFYELLTVASLIETEARRSDERGLIAAVIFNRLKKNMRLEIDATIQYILPERKKKIKKDDLWLKSPYNTYRNKGLPPTPICNPGREALLSAANPAKVNYLYYVLTDAKTGKHFFTDDYKEFLEVKRKNK